MSKELRNTRRHRGDIMTPAMRSRVMARIRGKNTGPERMVGAMLRRAGLAFRTHDRRLAGCPDFVLREHSLCVFVDGDFWHGWRFPIWRKKLSEKWEIKIEANRRRDDRNRRRLRRQGWRVLRIWEHQLVRDPSECEARILELVIRKLPKGQKLGSVAV
jgi:DNA mismatch endonuclease, patch repair protein